MAETIEKLYDTVISNNSERLPEAISQFEHALETANCKFGDQIVPTFLKPVFLSRQQSEAIRNIATKIIKIFEKVSRLYFSRPDLQEYFFITEKARPWIEVEPGYSRTIVISRPDAFFENGTIRFVEFNCDSPAGMGYCDVEEEVFLQVFTMQAIKEKFSLFPQSRSQALLRALLNVFREFAGPHKQPNIAIIDWHDVKTRNEFMILQRLFQKEGFKTIIADPRELQYKNGCLEAKGVPIHLIYRRVIFRELVAQTNEVKPLLRAYQDRKVCVANPLRSRLVSTKAILAIVTNPEITGTLLTEEEKAIIAKHIPWTRRICDLKKELGTSTSLLAHLMDNQQELVLKPADSYGGKDVIIGMEASRIEWEKYVGEVISIGEQWVAQRYVNVTQIAVPIIKDGGVCLEVKKYNLNPYILGGHYSGCLARLSDRRVINVSAGGGMVPVIEYDRKDF